MKYPVILLTLLFTLSAPLRAETIFTDDFQDANYGNWTMSGDGYDTINYYYGNYSMRLDGLRQGEIAVSSAGYENVSLSMDIAALYLVYGDYCYAEYSTDDGASWNILRWIGNGSDDGYFRTGTVSSGLDDNPDLRLRFRAYTLYYNYCYGDNVSLTGTPITGGTGPEIDVAGSAEFGNVAVGWSATNTLTVTNNGDAALLIGALNGLAAPFSVVNDNCSNQSIAPGNNCTADVRFAPTSTGSFSDTLDIPSNDADEASFPVAVSGTGIEAPAIYDPHSGDGNVGRTALTYSFLTTSGTLNLMDYSHYAVPVEAANPTNTFEGTLTLIGEATNGNAVEISSNNHLPSYPDAEHLPEFEFDFVQHGTHFIPQTRGKIEGSHASWAYVLEPGRVWNENGDNGWTRVAMPFTLQERNNDCLWNGVLTFLFKDDGSVSDVAYQFAGDTCLYMKVNFWGRLDASYTPGNVSGAATLKADYEAEVAGRMPVKPVSALATDYPSSGIIPANIGADVTAAHMSVYGVAYNGIHYTAGCETRYGSYPFCEVMNVPSYSTAKSVNAGYGLMRLEQKYSGSQRALGIDDYVSECTGFQWNATTFEHALDMATGNYDSAVAHADEGAQEKIDNFFYVNTHSQKVSFACGYPYKTSPGSTFVYHTSDTYLLGRGMQVYYQSQAGGNADFYSDVLVEEIYKPLGLSPTVFTTLRTQDTASQPHSGYGLVYVRDDVVKLAEFLNKAEGKIGSNQVLDSTMVNETLNLGGGGLNAGSSADRYNNGFWYYDLSQATTHNYGCSSATWVPYMSGYGGITVVLFPNDTIYYHFSDNDELGWANAGRELDKLAPMCP